jgi:proteasome lid subunit RPN8/RPN11
VHIIPEVLAALHRHVTDAYPYEGCGFLLGTDGPGGIVAKRGLPAQNQRTEDGAARSRFLVTPAEFLAAERAALAEGLQLVGVYHSHPDSPAVPSEYDREHAWPNLGYLIISVVRGRPREARVWQLGADRDAFVERDLVVKGN